MLSYDVNPTRFAALLGQAELTGYSTATTVRPTHNGANASFGNLISVDVVEQFEESNCSSESSNSILVGNDLGLKNWAGNS